jgi:hypothetical protein
MKLCFILSVGPNSYVRLIFRFTLNRSSSDLSTFVELLHHVFKSSQDEFEYLGTGSAKPVQASSCTHLVILYSVETPEINSDSWN